MVRLLAQIHLRFHWFPQRVNRGVRNLGGVDEDFVPVDWIFLGITHRGEQHPAGTCLPVDFLNGLSGPVGVFLKSVVGFDDFKRSRRAEGHTAVAVDAFAFVRRHTPGVGVVMVYFVGALPFTDPAGDAAVVIANHFIVRIEKIDCHYFSPPFKRTITGSPPRGAQMRSS